jgi:isoaspartyl peptidase/L-asparaginase-like protein (Ntn-hydrolase superfamily)
MVNGDADVCGRGFYVSDVINSEHSQHVSPASSWTQSSRMSWMDCSILVLRDADGRMSDSDVVGVVVIDRSGEIVACTDSQSCLWSARLTVF